MSRVKEWIVRRKFQLTALILLAGMIWYFDIPHQRVEKVPSIHGETLAEVLSEYGAPTDRTSFNMSQVPGEFRVELNNFYPPTAPHSAAVTIQELNWRYTPYTITAWFHKVDGTWVVLDTCRWKRGVQF